MADQGVGTAHSADQLENIFSNHLAQIYPNPNVVEDLRQHFLRDSYIKMPDLIPPQISQLVRMEGQKLLQSYAISRDIVIHDTGNTPRRMKNVSRAKIAAHGEIIPLLYECRPLMRFLGRIANDILVPCWQEEEYLLTALECAGDSHGWHWDDFPNTLIWVLEAPPAEYGGTLQCVPRTRWDKKQPRVDELLKNNRVYEYHHNAGDVYFLKGDTTLHRVAPLVRDARRVILNTCWSSAFDRRESVDHSTVIQGFVEVA